MRKISLPSHSFPEAKKKIVRRPLHWILLNYHSMVARHASFSIVILYTSYGDVKSNNFFTFLNKSGNCDFQICRPEYVVFQGTQVEFSQTF